jgi:hypothetical protein
VLRLQKTAGNAAVAHSLQRDTQNSVVSRAEEAGHEKPAVKAEGTEFKYDFPAAPLVGEVKFPKSPVKLKSITLTGGAKVKFSAPAKAEEGGGTPTVSTGAKFGGENKVQAGVSGELGTLASGHINALKQNLKAEGKMEYAAAGSPGEVKTGMSVTGSVQNETWKGTPLENFKVGGEVSLFEVNWKAKTGRVPELSVAKLSLNTSYETPPIDHFFPSMGQKGAVTFKGTVTAEFEPDWETIVPWLVEQIGAETLAEVGGPVAFAAAGAAVMYYTFKDMDRQEKLALTVRSHAKQIVRSGDTYASVLSGRKIPRPTNPIELEAFNTATADLEQLAKSRKIDSEIYRGLMTVPEYAKPVWDKTGESYVTSGLGSLESRVDKEIDAWHSDHYVKTFFSGRYASADKAMVNAIISEVQANPND